MSQDLAEGPGAIKDRRNKNCCRDRVILLVLMDDAGRGMPKKKSRELLFKVVFIAETLYLIVVIARVSLTIVIVIV